MPKFTTLLKSIGLAAVCTSPFILTACDNANSANAAKQTNQSHVSATATATPSNPAITPTVAVSSANNAQLQQLLQANLAKSGIDTQIVSVVPTSMPNIYWVKAKDMPALFTDSTGQYDIQGDIIKVGGAKPENISRDLQARDAKAALASLDKKDMMIFPAKGTTKGVINVFTDADCAYCRKLHSQIDEINALGIEVRYLPWPRSEQTFPIMEKIWCSSDRNTALTQAKQGMPIDAPACENPVQRIHDLGLSIGINGTPAIFTPDGQQIGGYLPPQELAKALGI